MAPNPTSDAEVLYEATARFTNLVEYGTSFQGMLSGTAKVPPAGARFDVEYQGALAGSRLSGTVAGTDYLYVRADGRAQLHIHGRITTPDGANVSLFAEAAGSMREGAELLQVRESVALYSAFPDCAWVNGLGVWAEGAINPVTGEMRVKAYAVT